MAGAFRSPLCFIGCTVIHFFKKRLSDRSRAERLLPATAQCSNLPSLPLVSTVLCLVRHWRSVATALGFSLFDFSPPRSQSKGLFSPPSPQRKGLRPAAPAACQGYSSTKHLPSPAAPATCSTASSFPSWRTPAWLRRCAALICSHRGTLPDGCPTRLAKTSPPQSPALWKHPLAKAFGGTSMLAA